MAEPDPLAQRTVWLTGTRRNGLPDRAVCVRVADRAAEKHAREGQFIRVRERKTERNSSTSENPTPVLKLFVYGTLKRGCRNHQDFCRGYVEVREASVRGRLYEGPGYPILEAPEEDILAQGTDDPVADAATQARLSNRVRAGLQQFPEATTGEGWNTVYGELFTFDDPEIRLPSIDRLEGFHPGGRCLYRRVQVSASVEGAHQPAWVYVVETLGISRRRIASGRWPE